MLSRIVDGAPDLDFDLILFKMLESIPVPGVVTLALMVLSVVLIAIFFVTGADSASTVLGGLSERGAEDPTKRSVVFWGVATGAVAAIMLLAGGSEPAEALNWLKNITIVSSLPFVLVMLLLRVAIWKDLSKDPLMIRNCLARHVLEDSVDNALERHDGEPFELRTVEAVVEVSPADADRFDSAPISQRSASDPAASDDDGAERPDGPSEEDDAEAQDGSGRG